MLTMSYCSVGSVNRIAIPWGWRWIRVQMSDRWCGERTKTGTLSRNEALAERAARAWRKRSSTNHTLCMMHGTLVRSLEICSTHPQCHRQRVCCGGGVGGEPLHRVPSRDRKERSEKIRAETMLLHSPDALDARAESFFAMCIYQVKAEVTST